jgi:hypothetical protein
MSFATAAKPLAAAEVLLPALLWLLGLLVVVPLLLSLPLLPRSRVQRCTSALLCLDAAVLVSLTLSDDSQ